MRSLAWRVGLAALWLGACADPEPEVLPPLGHVVLHVDTDAPVPPPPGVEADPAVPPPLFDRLAVDVYVPGESEPCAGCSRELVLDTSVLADGGSFAIEPSEPTDGIRVRLRMFRSAGRVDGVLAPEATVQLVAVLPDVPREGSVDASVFLPTDAVGRPIGTLEAPVAAEDGRWDASRAGSWPGARPIDCGAPASEGEVCVPGGAFWMGSPLANASSMVSATRQRLVVLSPFYVDVGEITVASFRAAGVAKLGNVSSWSGDSDGDDLADWCTFTKEPDAARDALPVSCVSWNAASDYCLSRGKTLLSEAQFEYLAGGFGSRTYVWGFDQPTCSDAVWGRGATTMTGFDFACDATLPEGDIGGPLPLPADATPENLAPPRLRDWVRLPGGTVFDLAGNLEEWRLDRHNRQEEPCWSKPDGNVFYDPICDSIGVDGDLRTLRGGSWGSTAVPLRVAARAVGGPTDKALAAGIRCARPAPPAP